MILVAPVFMFIETTVEHERWRYTKFLIILFSVFQVIDCIVQTDIQDNSPIHNELKISHFPVFAWF